jgi:predicted nucleotidyltransferase
MIFRIHSEIISVWETKLFQRLFVLGRGRGFAPRFLWNGFFFNFESMTLAQIKSKVLPVFSGKPIKRAFVFGSFARKQNTHQSDLDILVELDPNISVGLIEFINIQIELEKQFGVKVDLVSDDGVSPYIRPFIDLDKKQIYEA